VRILALETTERIGTLAAMQDGNLLSEKELSRSQRSAQSLAPALRALLHEVGWQPADVDLVALTVGPGSFTGLRVGLSTAKAFAYAAEADILGMDTLETIASMAPNRVDSLAVAVDAQRGDVVAGRFARNEQGWFEAAGPAQLIAIDEWLASIPPDTAVAGPVLRKLAGRMPPEVTVLQSTCWAPTAAAVARLAARDYVAGRRDDLWQLVPRYSRRSAAEEKWEARQSGSAEGT
jgi:tRNA threonylcarbamoyladenosine biosynthesis protein TsaB